MKYFLSDDVMFENQYLQQLNHICEFEFVDNSDDWN